MFVKKKNPNKEKLLFIQSDALSHADKPQGGDTIPKKKKKKIKSEKRRGVRKISALKIKHKTATSAMQPL